MGLRHPILQSPAIVKGRNFQVRRRYRGPPWEPHGVGQGGPGQFFIGAQECHQGFQAGHHHLGAEVVGLLHLARAVLEEACGEVQHHLEALQALLPQCPELAGQHCAEVIIARLLDDLQVRAVDLLPGGVHASLSLLDERADLATGIEGEMDVERGSQRVPVEEFHVLGGRRDARELGQGGLGCCRQLGVVGGQPNGPGRDAGLGQLGGRHGLGDGGGHGPQAEGVTGKDEIGILVSPHPRQVQGGLRPARRKGLLVLGLGHLLGSPGNGLGAIGLQGLIDALRQRKGGGGTPAAPRPMQMSSPAADQTFTTERPPALEKG